MVRRAYSFSFVYPAILESNVTFGLTFDLHSFALTPFATTLGLHSHPCALRSALAYCRPVDWCSLILDPPVFDRPYVALG